MRSNYREMKKFVKMGLQLKADLIVFQKIFGLASIQENINVTRNKEVFVQIADILSDPIFRHPSVDITLVKEYLKYKGDKATAYDRVKTHVIEKVTGAIEKTKIIRHRSLRPIGVWIKSKIPHTRTLLGW